MGLLFMVWSWTNMLLEMPRKWKSDKAKNWFEINKVIIFDLAVAVTKP